VESEKDGGRSSHARTEKLAGGAEREATTEGGRMPLQGAVRQVGPYVLGRKLGVGGFASVCEATHEQTKERVALKCIERNHLNSDAMIKRETALCRTLRHQNIVAYKAHYVTERAVYLALELAEGGELYDQLEQAGKFTEAKARDFLKQIVDGVSYCHTMGVCHRDLKLENLLLSADGTLKITDLGFSTQFTNASPKSVVGTALYVAPEVVLRDGREYNGEAADVWSIGIILYLLTAGRFPFNRGQAGGVGPGMSRATKDRFRNDNFRVMPHFSPSLVSLLRRILCADPLRRATIAEIRQHEWYTSGNTRDSTATSGGEASPVATPPHTPASTPDNAARAPAARLDFAPAVKMESGMSPPVVETGESAASERFRQGTNQATPHNIIEEELPWDVITPILEGDVRNAGLAANEFDFRDPVVDDLYESEDEPWESAEEAAWHAAREVASATRGNRAGRPDEVALPTVEGLAI